MAHIASLSQLQTPPWALINGELIRYADARIHISAEELTRALSVFEGVKGYWNTTGDVFAVADLIVTAFTQQKHDPHPMRLGVSTWRRAALEDLSRELGLAFERRPIERTGVIRGGSCVRRQCAHTRTWRG